MDTMEDAKPRTRRRHDWQLKQAVLAECSAPGASVAKVALAHGLNANLVHKWRREAGEQTKRPTETFIPVALPTTAPAVCRSAAGDPTRVAARPRQCAGELADCLGGDLRCLAARDRHLYDKLGTMCLIFLDIDGVLHSVTAPDDALLSKLPLLETWLRTRPEVDVVVSSSWRLSHTLEQLQAYFSPDLRARVIGVTDLHWRSVYEEMGEVPLNDRHERELEVMRWLSRHGGSRPWAALEDERELYGPGCSNVVACDGRKDLTLAGLKELDRLLPRRGAKQ